MRLGVVGDLVAHARFEREPSSVLEFGFKLSFRAQKDVTLDAPVICQVARRVLDHAYADRSEVAGLPVGFSRLACVLSFRNRRPVRRSERDALHVHGVGSPCFLGE